MNYFLLKSFMYKHQDNRETLAEYLGIHAQTLYMKMRDQEPRQQFTQEEIRKIAQRYSLTADEVMQIFFN